MIDFNLLEILVSFEKNKTLLKTAEDLHISQPALTVSMKKIEKELDTNIFNRSKNHISLNANGIYAVALAKNLLKEKDDMIIKIKNYDKSHTTIRVGMSAIAPNLYFLPGIEKKHNIKIISRVENENEIIRKLKNKDYDIIFLTSKLDITGFQCKKSFSENLYFFLNKKHPLANKKSISFKEMDGESLLMSKTVGFWEEVVRENMPNSNFILQDSLDNLRILIDNSTISAFASNLTLDHRTIPNRVAVKISDKSANEDFFIAYSNSIDKKLIKLFI